MVLVSKYNLLIGSDKISYDLVDNASTIKNDFIFYSQNTILSEITETLEYKILRFKAPLTPQTANNGSSYLTKAVMVANGNYSNLDFSLLSFKIKEGKGIGLRFSEWGMTYNQSIDFDATFLAQLQTTDTIAVQEYILRYETR